MRDDTRNDLRIAVTTPTGNVGRHVTAGLVRAGLRPVVLARDPDRVDAALRPHVDAREVDQYDADSVASATRDVGALFWVDPPPSGPNPLAGYARATESVVRAVRDNRIGRVVFQSSVGAERRRGAGEIDGLAATEVELDRTGADVLHLRCGYFFSNLAMQLDTIRTGTVSVIVPLDQPMPWVAPRDIAEVAIARLLAPGWTGRQVQGVHGPADLTWPEACEIVAAATGRPLRAERVGDDEMRETLRGAGMGEQQVESIIGMSAGLRDGFVPEQPRSVHTTTPTTLAGWAYDELRPQL